MAIPPALRAPQGCVAALPGDKRPPLRRARHADRQGGQGEDTEERGSELPNPRFTRHPRTWSKVR